ncbi:unnamed protein product [Cylindrotheca closterium]|uniref:HIT domain-containing protein n=1 Tax=Cylindrotheca closterium TaxID=2856 RepID=A0AAD2FM36_9STRA|nr:unnamed protein product [Cylindrotheca closterium]
MLPEGMKRFKFIGTVVMAGIGCFQFLTSSEASAKGPIESIPKATTYHAPPPGVDYSTNPSVFGQILSGKLPARTLTETTNLLAFEDRSPAAELHGLVIPKRYIESVFSLDSQSRTDIELVQEMHQMGLSLIEEYHPEALASGDYTLCFHIPPFTSVDHLHLHVLAPASSMSWWYGSVKYKCPKRWCVSDMTVLERLQEGKPAVPYNKPFKIFPTR